MMDFDIITSRSASRVMTTHRGDVDETPLQLISVQQLEYYKGVEAAYVGLLQHLAEEIAAAAPSATL